MFSIQYVREAVNSVFVLPRREDGDVDAAAVG